MTSTPAPEPGERDELWHDPDGCPHGDDPAICPPCRRTAGKDAALAHTPPAVEFRFTARYSGDCPACHLPIHVGQACARLTDGRSIHGACE